MTFKSKRGIGPIVFLMSLGGLFVVVLLSIRNARLPIVGIFAIAAVPALLTILFGWIVAATDYTIRGQSLLIRSGPFHWEVDIQTIASVRPSVDPTSSPALSLDRLNIVYDGGSEILVSPEERDGFIAALRAVNSAILSS